MTAAERPDVNTHPTADESFDRLHRAGWSAGYARFGRIWTVRGTNGENAIDAEGATLEEAYWPGCQQAREVGTLAPTRLEARC